VYYHFFQFDDNVSNSATWQPTVTVESGSPVYNISDNGKSFELESAVLNLGTDVVINGLATRFGLNIEIKVDSDATDGIILSCDDIANSRPCWTMELIDTATSPKIVIRTWTDGTTQSFQQSSSVVPSTGTWNNYQWEASSTTMYKRINGGSHTNSTSYTSYWGDLTAGLDSYIFEYRIGSSLYNTITAGATGVHLDWYVLSTDNEGYTVPSNVDTSVRSYPPEPSNAIKPPSGASIVATSNVSETTDCVVQSKRTLIATLYKIIREFWS
jgi:hypothetical protein